jgi:hypothetical protein
MKKLLDKGLACICLAVLVLAGCEQDTGSPSAPTLTGTVEISGEARVGKELTAVFTNPEVNAGTGTRFQYGWLRNRTGGEDGWETVQREENSERYTLTEDESGCYIMVVVSLAGYNGSVSSPADFGPVEPADDTVDIEFTGLEANGTVDTETTTLLTLTFSTVIEGLGEGDITLNPDSTGAVKGAFGATDSEGVYTLGISGISAAGELSVTVSKPGYMITPPSKTVTVALATVNFTGLEANGEEDTETTTLLTLTFSAGIEGLGDGDITLNPGSTGAVQGAFEATGSEGVYTLGISDISAAGELSVTVSKPGYMITPSSKTVMVHRALIQGSFTGLEADGVEDTETTTLLTLTFSDDIEGLAAADITVSPAAFANGTPTRTGTGEYTLRVIGVTGAGNVDLTVSKSGYMITPQSKTVTLHKKRPKSIKETFNVTASGVEGVRDAFTMLHDFIQDGGLTNDPAKISLGDYIDLEGGLTVAAYGGSGGFTIKPGTGRDEASQAFIVPFTAGYRNPGYSGVLLRLIVVGINSFNGKNGNDTPHVVFQFQNIPVTRGMGNSAGYSGIRPYLTGNFLTGLKGAGVPDGVLWAPTRKVAQSAAGDACDTITDKLWLPTELEMCGWNPDVYSYTRDSNTSAETETNQAWLEYYVGDNSRFKYQSRFYEVSTYVEGVIGYHWGSDYWVASPASQSSQWQCMVDAYGGPSRYNQAALSPYGIAPAFCVH